MENIIRRIFKICLEPTFDKNINLEKQELVISKILETGNFLVRKKTNIQFHEHFFMKYDEDCIIEKLTTLKYNSEFFGFKSVMINVTETGKENNRRSIRFSLDDFYSEIYKEKLKQLYDELTIVKKESNWSLISLKDILDVDYRKQTDKADMHFIRGEYLDAMKIYSRFKTEDDFSHYNMEMEVYCRYLTKSNPYANFIHLTNTNFVNSFYHHRLVIVLLSINQNEFCYRISRLLNEPYRMFIDLELSKRYLKGTKWFRKGFEQLFFCILYYRDMNFPCDELIERFIKSVNSNENKPNENFLKEPTKYLANLKSPPMSNEIDTVSMYKASFLSQFDDSLPKGFVEQRHFMLITYKDDEHNIFVTFNKDVNITLHDKIYICYISGSKSFLKSTILDQLTSITVNTREVGIESLCIKHVIFEHDINLQPSKCPIILLRDFINQVNLSKNDHLWCKEVSFSAEGIVVVDGLAIHDDIDITIDAKIQIDTTSSPLFFVNYEHVSYQYQVYNFEVTKPKNFAIHFEGFKTYENNFELKVDRSGIFYIPLKIFSSGKTFFMYIKFTVIACYLIDFSWCDIFPSLMTINIYNPSNIKNEVTINQLNDTEIILESSYKIEGKVHISTNCILNKTSSIGDACDVMLITSSYEEKLKREVLGIEDVLIEDFQDGEPVINSPVTTSLDFCEYLTKHKYVSFSTRGVHSIQFSPSSKGHYNITLKNEQQTFVIPFSIYFVKTDIMPFIYIISSSLIKTGTFVKFFCLINNHYDTDLEIEICSNTIEINHVDSKLTCTFAKSSIFEIRCKFNELRNYTNDDIQIKVSDKKKTVYNYKLCVDLKVI